MAGRKSTPNVIKLVKGNPGKRAINKAEPKPSKRKPTAPVWLSEKAKAAWPVIEKLLSDMNVLTISDGIALETLCEAYADLRSARESLSKPITIQGEGGKSLQLAAAGELTYITFGKGGPMVRNRPELALIADAERRLKASLSDFGLTPASRSKIQVLDDEEKDSQEEDFFNGR